MVCKQNTLVFRFYLLTALQASCKYVLIITVADVACRVLKVTLAQMASQDMMVHQEEMVIMEQREIMVILVILVHVEGRENV